jgi:hypothetical protein
MMAEILITLEGKHFHRQYLLYIVEIIHKTEKFYYVGQTGDNNYITARPAFRRLAGHLEDWGRSTQNQIYRYLAVSVLDLQDAARKDSMFDEKIKQSVENYLIESTVKMYGYHLQPFIAKIERHEHLEKVRKVRLFEQLVIELFLKNSKILMNKKISFPPKKEKCPYPSVLDHIKSDFNLGSF